MPQDSPAQPQQPPADPTDQSISEQATGLGFCTSEQLQEAIEIKRRLEEMGLGESLAEILLKKKFITPDQQRQLSGAAKAKPTLAGFEILEKVGQGGMGAVFKARQISMDRIVAIKVLPRKLAQNPTFKERFLREARLSAKLSHRNLINGIDCGESNGYTYFAMEFVEGKTLKQVLKERSRIPLDECLEVIGQIIEALKYAHDKQFIHRDIKPDNIMLTPGGAAKLCDLGLARSTESDPDLTTAGRAVGTPHYIAPEQAKGLEGVDLRADIYSLGATLYHLLSGKTLFPGNDATATMAKHLLETAPALTEVCPEVPAEVGMVVAKMLAKEPGERYSELGAVSADLAAARAGRRPQAAAFTAKSSCAMPSGEGRVSSRKPMLAGNTTGPRAPVRARGTTGPQSPIGPRSTTGPLSPIRPRVLSVEGRSSDPAKGLSTSHWLLAGAALLVLILVLAFLRSGKPEHHSAQGPIAALGSDEPKPGPRAPAANGGATPAANTGPGAPAAWAAGAAGLTEPPQSKLPLPLREPPPRATGSPLDPVLPDATGVRTPEPAEPQTPRPAVLPAPAAAAPPPGKVAPAPPSSAAAQAAAGEGGQAALRSVEPAESPERKELPDASAPLGLLGLHAEFLAGLRGSSRGGALTRLKSALQELRQEKRFEPIQARTAQDLALLELAIDYQDQALTALAAKGASVALPPGLAMGPGAAEGKVLGYEAGRGLRLKVSGAEVAVEGEKFPCEQVLSAHPRQEDFLGAAAYCYQRGEFERGKALLKQAAAEAQGPLAERIRLVEEGPAETRAEEAFGVLAECARKEQWSQLLKGLAPFRSEHGSTRLAKAKIPDLERWQQRAELALSPLTRLFHAKRVTPGKNDFLEIEYDFTTPQQLEDFTVEGSQLQATPRGLVVSTASVGKEKGDAKKFPYRGAVVLKIPLLELKGFELSGSATPGGIGHLGVGLGDAHGSAILRGICLRAHAKDRKVQLIGAFEPEVNPKGKRKPFHSDELTFEGDLEKGLFFKAVAENRDKGVLPMEWGLGKKKFGGKVVFPITGAFHLTLFGQPALRQLWSRLRLSAKPDPEWLAKAKDALLKD